MTRFGPAFAAYVVLLLVLFGASCLFGPGRETAEGTAGLAATDLPAGHQLRSGDVLRSRGPEREAAGAALDELVGLHLTAAVDSGDPVEPSKLAAVPELAPPPNHELAILEMDAGDPLLTIAAVSDRLRVCLGGKNPACRPTSVRVISVHRPVSEGDAAWIAVSLPTAAAAELAPVLASDDRLLLVAAEE